MKPNYISFAFMFFFSIFVSILIFDPLSVETKQPMKQKPQSAKPQPSKVRRAKLDSLLSVLPQKGELSDTNGLKLLAQISIEYTNIDPATGLKFAERQLNLARSLNFRRGEAGAYNIIGINLHSLSRFSEAIDSYKKGLKLAEELGDKKLAAGLSANIGGALMRMGQCDKALGYYELSYKIALEIGNKKEITNYLLRLSHIHHDCNDFRGALEYAEKTLKAAREIKDDNLICGALRMIGIGYKKLFDYGNALKYQEKALEIALKTGDIIDIADNYSDIGEIYMNMAAYKEAIDQYSKALKIFEEAGNKQKIGICLNGISLATIKLSDYSTAMDCISRARKIWEFLGDKNNLCVSINNIGMIYSYKADYEKAMESFNLSLKLAEESGNKTMISGTIGNLGFLYIRMAEFTKAMESYQKALEIGQELNNKRLIRTWLSGLGNLYHDMAEYEKALDWYNKSKKIAEEMNDKFSIASTLGYIADVYNHLQKYNEAIDKYNTALSMFKDMGIRDLSLSLSNIGDIYFNMADYSKAMEYYQLAMNDAARFDNEFSIASQSAKIGSTNLAMSVDSSVKDTTGRYENLLKSAVYMEKAIKSFGLRNEQKLKMDYLYKLEQAYSALGYHDKALAVYKEARTMQDSVFSSENRKKIAELEAKRELEVKARENEILQQKTRIQQLDIAKQGQAFQLLSSQRKVQSLDLARKNSQLLLLQKDKSIKDLELKKTKAEGAKKARDIAFLTKESQYQSVVRSSLIGAFVLASAIALLIFFFLKRKSKDNRKLHDLNEAIKSEQDKSESLLQNILPAPVASRLKEGEKHLSDYFDEASIVFIDIVDFSLYSSNTTPERLIEVLNNVYTEFDSIAEKYGLEKIKTIGDCYMAVSGVPVRNPNHAMDAAKFATEAMSTMNGSDFGDGRSIYFRTGIDCGPVIAGVIGEKKFIYDLWGDAVNTASRMEEFGVTGRIQCTERFRHAYYNSDGHDSLFSFKERGKIEVKGKGYMNTYFLEKQATQESEIAW